MTLRLVLVDDHPVVRAGLRAFIESSDDLRVVGEASDAAGAVEIVATEQPDVVLMDLSLGDGVGGGSRPRAASPLSTTLPPFSC